MDEHPQLGALLVRKGLLSPEQLEAALARQKISNRRLGEELVRRACCRSALFCSLWLNRCVCLL